MWNQSPAGRGRDWSDGRNKRIRWIYCVVKMSRLCNAPIWKLHAYCRGMSACVCVCVCAADQFLIIIHSVIRVKLWSCIQFTEGICHPFDDTHTHTHNGKSAWVGLSIFFSRHSVKHEKHALVFIWIQTNHPSYACSEKVCEVVRLQENWLGSCLYCTILQDKGDH